jgi:hypothetical protein
MRMSEEFQDLLVGLIAIEPLAADPLGNDIPGDATLGQFLIHLAMDAREDREITHHREAATHELRLARHESRFGGWPTTCWDGPLRLSANLDHLTAELGLALTRIRREIAASCHPTAE